MQTWSLEAANAALPEVKRMLATARDAVTALRMEQEQLEDLKIVYGAAVETEGGQGHGEWQLHARRHGEARQRYRAALQAFDDRGIKVKDIDAGLIDFYALRGDELVFLCWKEGETAIRTWHPLEGGYAKRKPVGSFVNWRKA